jgi:hypothetical protein
LPFSTENRWRCHNGHSFIICTFFLAWTDFSVASQTPHIFDVTQKSGSLSVIDWISTTKKDPQKGTEEIMERGT